MHAKKILKFGGTSLGSPERIKQAAAIVIEARATAQTAVVVSAMGGTTNDLTAASARASARDVSWEELYHAQRARHLDAAKQLAPIEEHGELEGQIQTLFGDLKDLLHGVFLLRECSPRTLDSIVSFGERLSAPLLAACLRNQGIPALAVDARKLIVTDDSFGKAVIDREATQTTIENRLIPQLDAGTPIVTGFISATSRGETTTLGRGGSDYTAAILGEAIHADIIEIWTDVSGVFSADPRRVPEAFPLDQISYEELMELSHFGAKVVHPPSVHPAKRAGIPLAIRNTMEPTAPGTLITSDSAETPHLVRGITSIHRVDLLRLEGDGMVGVPGVAMRLFGCLARSGVSVILISQASSEHSICWAVSPEDSPAAERAVATEFELELRLGIVDPLIADRNQSVVAIVGERMREKPGLASRLFGALARHSINVRAVAQGSSELNISLVIAGDDEVAALRAIHSTFFSPSIQRVRLALLGCGQVGSAVLAQIPALAQRLLEKRSLNLLCVAIANSRSQLRVDSGIDLENWAEPLDSAPAGSLAELALWLAESPDPAIVIDATASGETGKAYPAFLKQGHAIVAANKKPFCCPYSEFLSLFELANAQETAVRLEATVGAGLPVLSTLESQLEAGDPLDSVVGVVSGSLNFLCERLRAGVRFSEALREADQLGFLEPNPWDDLSGQDALRKITILARMAGFKLEPSQVELRPFLSDPTLAGVSAEELWSRIEQYDDEFERRQREAEEQGRRWRYVVSFDGHKAMAGLQAVSTEHPCFSTEGPESLVAFKTRHYSDSALVIRGPGAGPAVTASGILVDVRRILESLNQPGAW